MNDEKLKRYSASFYDKFACNQRVLLIKAANRLEAASTALMLMGKSYTIEDIDTLEEENNKYYYTYEDAYNRYKVRYNNEDPLLPEAKWDEEEQAWYYKEDENGERYYI